MEKYTITINDLIEQCRDHMASNGLPISETIITNTNKPQRYSKDNNKRKKDEWYMAFEHTLSTGKLILNCVYGSWSTGEQYLFKSSDCFSASNAPCDKSEIQEINRIWQEQKAHAEVKLLEEKDQAAKKAFEIWETSSEIPPTEECIAYLEVKKIQSIGIKYNINSHRRRSSLIIPIRNIAGEIRSLQFIFKDMDGTFQKRFLSGGEKQGNFNNLGDISKANYIYITEGYATGVSIYEATKQTVVIAFDAGNIKHVVQRIYEQYPHKELIIAADNDERGIFGAKAALGYPGVTIVFPNFPDHLKEYKDFNDLHQHCGIEEVKRQLCVQQPILERIQLDEVAKRNPCHQFRINKLPPVLAEYIFALSKTTNAHPIMIAASVITMVSAFFGKKVCIPEGYDGYFQDLYPNTWILCIAKSGQFKTTALNKGAKYAYDNQTIVLRDIKILKDTWEKTEDHAAKEYIANEIVQRSLDNVILPTKITAEAFVAHLSEGHRGVIYTSEFGAMLQNFEKSHNNDFKATLTEFYDVPKFYQYKTKTQGNFIIEKPYLSICGVSTLPWIRENLKPSDVPSGFFPRFLIFTPPHDESIPPALPQAIDHDSECMEQAFQAHFKRILIQIDKGRLFRLTPDARRRFEKLHNIIHMVPEGFTDRAKDITDPYLKRWSPYLLKIAMIMQLFIDADEENISQEAIDAAWFFLLPAIKSTMFLFEGELGESSHQRQCRKVYDWLLKKHQETGMPIKRSALLSSKQLEGGSKQYDDILETLAEQERIRIKTAQNKSDYEYQIIEQVSDHK